MAAPDSAPGSVPRTWLAILGLCLVSIPIVFYGLGSYSVVNGDEAFYHAVARNMLESGNWLRLEFTGEHRVYDTFMNAPLQYWARAALIAGFGDNAWTLRFLSAAFALASVLMTFRLTAILSDARTGFLAGLIQLTTYQFVYIHSARTGELEPMLCFALTLTAYLFLRALETGRSFVWHHLSIVLLLNLKAPLALVPVMAELAFFVLSSHRRPRLRAWLAAAWVLPLGLAWHLGQLLSLDRDAWAVLARMLTQASGSGLERETGVGRNVIYYGATLLYGAFPYSLIYPLAIVGVLATPASETQRQGVRLVLAFAVALLGFFAVVAKALPWYIDPLSPFLSLVLALWLSRLRAGPIPAWVLVGVAALLAVAAGVQVMSLNPFALRGLTPLEGQVVWRDCAPWLVPGLALSLALILAWVRRRGGERSGAWLSSALAVVLLAAAATRVAAPLRHVDHESALDRLHAELSARRAAGEAIAFPVPVTEPGKLRVRYYFGDDYEIVRVAQPARDGAFFSLVAEGQTPYDPPLPADASR